MNVPLHAAGIVGCMDLDRDSPVALYEQLAGEMRARIAGGKITRRLPSIADLVEEFGVARDTAARALQVLESEGTAVRSRGRGYWVAKS